MHRTRRFLAALAVPAMLAAAPSHAAAPIKVTVSQAFQSLLYLPLYVGLDEGFFAKDGLSVDKETAGSPQAALSAVLSHSADFSIHGPEWAAIADSKGADVKLIANVVNRAAVWIAAAPGYHWTGVAALKGQNVVTGMMPTTSTSLFLKLLRQNGMSQDSVDLIEVQIGSEPGPFVAGRAKVAVMYEPGLDQVVAQGMKVVLGFPEQYGPYAFSSVLARADESPEKARLFVEGMQQALHYIATDEAGTLKVAEKEFPGLDPKVVDAAVDRMRDAKVWPDTVATTAEALKVAMQTQIALGNLPAQPDYATFVTQTYVQAATAGGQ